MESGWRSPLLVIEYRKLRLGSCVCGFACASSLLVLLVRRFAAERVLSPALAVQLEVLRVAVASVLRPGEVVRRLLV